MYVANKNQRYYGKENGDVGMKVEIKDVSKVINGNPVLDSVSIEMESGKIYGLQGKNGCGKTMLMRMICGLVRPTTGEIKIDDSILNKDISFPESLGVLIENPSFLPHYTAFENLKLLAGIRGKISEEQIKEVLSKVGLEPNDKRKYKKFSLGMKQRLGIACAIMEEPKFIILDEPFNALDSSGVTLIKNLILELKKNGAMILLACHDIEELKYLSDEIFVMQLGKVIEVVKQ